MSKQRLDKLLVERGLVESREKAQRLIRAGQVRVNGAISDKPGIRIDEQSEITLAQQERYFSRGGEKLEGALHHFQLNVDNWIVADIGASTGGFTDCLLQSGVQKVYALDVGKGQLHWQLRNHPRVVVMEGINARYLNQDTLPEKVDLVTVDVSFISLEKIIPAALTVLKEEGKILALVKPQFEVGKQEVEPRGVIRSLEKHQRVLRRLHEFAATLNLKVIGTCQSPLKGAQGNIEYFMLLQR